MMSIKKAYVLTLVSLIGLMILVIVWNGWFAKEQNVPVSFELAVFCLPLLLFLRGALNGKRGTFVSLMVVAFFYFMAGIWHIVEPAERGYGVLMVLLSLGLYLGGYFYAKAHDKIARARLDAQTEAAAESDS